MLPYLLSMLAGFWLGVSVLLYVTFYWIEEVWDLPLTEGESASNAHARLQSLVQRVIEEALRLPGLREPGAPHASHLPPFRADTYEDLLATAILNKVIDRYQHEVKTSAGASSSGVHSGSSSPAGAPPGPRRRPRGRPSARDSSPDRSSPEPLSHDDYAHSDSSGRATDGPHHLEELTSHQLGSSTDDEGQYTKTYSNPVEDALSNISFRHKNRIIFPEYGGDIVEITEKTRAMEDQLDGEERPLNTTINVNSEIYANNNSWEENWLFQKKRVKAAHSVPVPMLIPNSNTEYRAMIGDRDADDTTDLSEAGSEAEESSTDIKQVLVNSKTIIGGKNPDIILALIDQDIIENAPLQNGFQLNEKFDKDISTIGGILSEDYLNNDIKYSFKDENDNKTQDTEQDIKPVITDKVNSDSDPMFMFRYDQPIKEEVVPITKNNNIMQEFLLNLEPVDEIDDICYGISSHFDPLSPSASDQNLFETEKVNEATNLDVIEQNDGETLESLDSHQQESEYTETVAIPVQRHIDSLRRQHNLSKPNLRNDPAMITEEKYPTIPLPAPKSNTPELTTDNIKESIDLKSPQSSTVTMQVDKEETDDSHIQFTMNGKPFEETPQDELLKEEYIIAELPGSIAEREHKKWQNPVPMPNNPYSPEAIQCRLNKQRSPLNFDVNTNTSTPTPPPTPATEVKTNGILLQEALNEGITEFKRYGRDYYINQSKRATGGKENILQDMKFDLLPDNSIKNELNTNPLVRASSDTADPAWKTESALVLTDNWNGTIKEEVLEHKSEPEILYSATPAIVSDVDSQFDDIYKNNFKYSIDEPDNYVLPENINNSSGQDLVDLTNGEMIVTDNDSMDQSDSVSSVDNSLRVYNIQTGKVISRVQSKVTDDQIGEDENHVQNVIQLITHLHKEGNRGSNSTIISNNIKSWKSTGDVYWDANGHKDDIRSESKIESDIELPSVKDLAEMFRVKSVADPPQIKPKRRISRELLENEIIHKTYSNSQNSLKQPQYMHSLTARSISKEFRDELKLSMPVHTNIHPGGSKYIPGGTDEPIREGKSSSRSGSPHPEPGSIKNKLEFFEQLTKISTPTQIHYG